MTGEGEGKEGNACCPQTPRFWKTSSSPLPLPLPPCFFRSRSNFRAITRLETLAKLAKRNFALTVIFESNDMRK